MTSTPDVVILADHSALLAIPAFAPAILVVAVVIWVARRDRRLGDDEDDDLDADLDADEQVRSERATGGDEDGSP